MDRCPQLAYCIAAKYIDTEIELLSLLLLLLLCVVVGITIITVIITFSAYIHRVFFVCYNFLGLQF